MDEIDALGRRRTPGQNRGLRPLYPVLPQNVESRVMRVAMLRPAWERLDAMVLEGGGGTRPRALGALLEKLLAAFDSKTAAELRYAVAGEYAPASDWQDWQIHKERSLLFQDAGAF